jgi:hypothetical protein
MSTRFIGVVGFLLLLSGIGAPCAQSQAPDSTLQDRVERAVHGPDGEGRDGPMARLDRDLIRLYYEYRAHQETGAEAPFAPSDDGLLVREARVTVDAIASSRPAALLDSLRALGLQDGAQAQRLVSGRLPIDSLRAAAQLSLLQSMRAAQARTRTNTGGMRPPLSPDAHGQPAPETTTAQPEATVPDTASRSSAEPSSPALKTSETDSSGYSPSGSSRVRDPVAAEKTDSAKAVRSETDSAASHVPGDGFTDMGSDTAERSQDEGPFRWEYVVGGAVLLALGLLVVLRRA